MKTVASLRILSSVSGESLRVAESRARSLRYAFPPLWPTGPVGGGPSSQHIGLDHLVSYILGLGLGAAAPLAAAKSCIALDELTVGWHATDGLEGMRTAESAGLLECHTLGLRRWLAWQIDRLADLTPAACDALVRRLSGRFDDRFWLDLKVRERPLVTVAKATWRDEAGVQQRLFFKSPQYDMQIARQADAEPPGEVVSVSTMIAAAVLGAAAEVWRDSRSHLTKRDTDPSPKGSARSKRSLIKPATDPEVTDSGCSGMWAAMEPLSWSIS